MSFSDLVAAEIARARKKHRNINSLHEGKAVIEEEFDEFWDAVKLQTQDHDHILTELVQTAAMCQRTAEDTGLVSGPTILETDPAIHDAMLHLAALLQTAGKWRPNQGL